ncbi:hypothetical protein CALVIDRAFT_507275 [Calocera viscosa TUFC12733]|uniref:Nucleolar protein 12 n=1 Tax=Calocera viscosa (strain TUFC12733) TaxID=1330018 RepID=A0A167G250_CALVF|nr:hypothetical protein CALVIDRAFT_507275 [Calocera viscosa TUFC12733]
MSLSSVLLSKGAVAVDGALDSIFKSNPLKPAPKLAGHRPPRAADATTTKSTSLRKEKKRKTQENPVEETQSKKRRLSNVKTDKKVPAPAGEGPKERKKKNAVAKSERQKTKKEQGRDEEVEPAFPQPGSAPKPKVQSDIAEDISPSLDKAVEDATDEDGDDDDDALPVHESLLDKTGDDAASSKKRKRIDETQEERDARTVFVGNIAVTVVKTKSLRKQLTHHLTSFVPNSEVESIRFRSVAFKNPTSQLPEEDDKKGQPSAKDLKSKERAQKWRKQAADPSAGIVFLSEAEKKKVAFIKGEIHDGIDTVNAYVVFAHPTEETKEGETSAVSPAEVAKLVVEAANGTTFLSKTLRVDHVGKQAAGWGTADPKLTVFVGNLDFAAKEEAIRSFFEELVKTERGDTENTWVKTVRVVRDKATQLGKGFAYVSVADRECVDHILAADAEQLKFAKRTLRVQRCKVAPSTKSTPVKGPRPSSEKGEKTHKQKSDRTPVEVPRGDPSLGERLAGLDKEARKAAKATDQDRLARRLAKKKARAALQKGPGAADLDRGKRERKPVKNHGKGTATKPRMRSDRAIAKRNQKK